MQDGNAQETEDNFFEDLMGSETVEDNTSDDGKDKEGGEGGNADGADGKEGGEGDKGGEGGKDAKDAGAADGDGKGDDKGGNANGEVKKEEETKFVPVAALEAERAKRRAMAQRLEAIENRQRDQDRANLEAALPKQGTPEYAEYQAQQAQVQAVNQSLNRSEYDARKEHGDETVTEMMAWAAPRFESDPAWAKKVFGHAHPFDFAVREYKAEQEKKAQEAPANSDPNYAKFLEWMKSQEGGGVETPPAKDAGGEKVEEKLPMSLAQQAAGGGKVAPPSDTNSNPFDLEFT